MNGCQQVVTNPDAFVDNSTFLFTSESVGEGHSDKLCDQISDAVVDAFIALDPDAKIECEVAVKSHEVFVFGTIHSTAVEKVNIEQVVRDTIKNIGYLDESIGFDYAKCEVHLNDLDLENREQEIISSTDEELGASDQAIVFGYATDETPELMPLTLVLSQRLNRRLAECRKNGTLPWSRPDSKTQVTIEFKSDHGALIPLRVAAIVVSAQHDPSVPLEKLRQDLMTHVVKPVIPKNLVDDRTEFFLNPSGSFNIGGPKSDAGLTGRKIIVDTYGGWGAHGGGAFSGKDPSKIARSAGYAARWAAKSLVSARLCRRCLVQLSYANARPEPISVSVFHYGTAKDGLSANDLRNVILKNFDFRPGQIIRDLKLRRPIYQKTACYGHFGREEAGDFTWEKVKPISL